MKCLKIQLTCIIGFIIIVTYMYANDLNTIRVLYSFKTSRDFMKQY